MNWLAPESHRGVRLALVIHLATVLLTAVVPYGWAQRLSGELPWAVIPVGILATVSVSTLVLARTIRRLTVWERRLASLSAGQLDPLSLMPASGSSAADHGWNRLLEQGRRWQALSELEQAVAALAAQYGHSDASPLLDALADGVAAVDAGGAITYANAVMAAICGADSPEPLRGRNLVEAIGLDPSIAVRLNEPALQAEGVVEWCMRTGDGHSRTLRGTRRPVSGDSGQVSVQVWTVRDVTQQRLAEAMREQFLATATHEFRTPLANIRAYAESLSTSPDIDPQEQKHFYNIIQSESVRLAQLVDDLLDISRMQAGALALDCRETDLGRLVAEAAAKVQAQMQEKNLQFRCEMPPKFPKAAVDKSKLTAALVNLLGNAAKYTPDGGRVTFRMEVGAQHVQFAVTDSGIGISPDELPRVFERFFRSTDDRVRKITGSGLGLALSQEIARLHGGDITVESTLNKGSTFHLSIPLDSAA